jgi:hypothetical protein
MAFEYSVATFDMRAAQNWVGLNQLHAEYTQDIRTLRASEYASGSVLAILTTYMRQISSPANPWELRCVRFKYFLQLMLVNPVKNALPLAVIDHLRTNFMAKFNWMSAQGGPNAVCVEIYQDLIDQVARSLQD